MSNTPPADMAPSLDSVAGIVIAALGSGLIGTWFTTLLSGIAISQAFSYFNHFPKDTVWMKTMVGVVTSLNFLHTISVWCISYRYLVRTYSIVNKFGLDWSVSASLFTHVIIAGIVLCYFIHVCFRLLSGKKIQIPVIVILFIPTCGHIVFGIATSIKTVLSQDLFDLTTFKKFPTIPMLSAQLASDVLVSMTLCLGMPRASYKRTRDVVQRVILYTVSRGICTSAAALVELIALVVAGNSLWWVSAEFIVAGLYTNSLLLSLNMRRSLRRRLTASDDPTAPTSLPLAFYRVHADDSTGIDSTSAPTSQRDQIRVDIYNTQKRDDGCTDKV